MLKVNQKETEIKKCQISSWSDFVECIERMNAANIEKRSGKVYQLRCYLH